VAGKCRSAAPPE